MTAETNPPKVTVPAVRRVAARKAQEAREATERQQAHQVAIHAYNRAQAALYEAQKLVAYLEHDVATALAACQSFMPPK